MTGRTANRPLRKAVWWSIGVRVAGVLLLALSAAAGIRVGSTARLTLALAMSAPLVLLVTRTATAYSRYRRGGLTYHLARATIDFARERGARALEAYPMITQPGKDITWGELHVGARQVFEDAGFEEVSWIEPSCSG